MFVILSGMSFCFGKETLAMAALVDVIFSLQQQILASSVIKMQIIFASLIENPLKVVS